DDQLYKFREGDFKRLCCQDIEDMLLLLVQEKLTNLNLDKQFALNVALRMYHTLSFKNVWRIYNWQLKATRRRQTSQDQTHTV
ncbi:hypothetical protein Tco_1477691, partial [Tanacetum coccineum]